MEQETPKNTTALDSLIQDRQLQMLKAAVPYISNSSQKTIAFLIKFMELERTVSIFNNPEASLKMCSVSESDEPPVLQLLSDLREYCTEKEQETLDMIMNYMQMFSAYGTLFT